MINKMNLWTPTIANTQFGETQTPKIANAGNSINNFGNMLKSAIENLNDSQIASDRMTDALVKGKNVDLHQVMIASEKAGITLQATMEIRNKAIEAYQEIMRMSV